MGIIVVIAGLIMIIATFEAGRSFGLHEARRVGEWGENYARNFGRPTGPGFGARAPLPGGHGAEGTITDVTLPTFRIVDENHPEETVRVSDGTLIRGSKGNVASTTLATGQNVIILGTPDSQGVINAKFIRITPSRQSAPAVTK
jgi:hypothetical protein